VEEKKCLHNLTLNIHEATEEMMEEKESVSDGKNFMETAHSCGIVDFVIIDVALSGRPTTELVTKCKCNIHILSSNK